MIRLGPVEIDPTGLSPRDLENLLLYSRYRRHPGFTEADQSAIARAEFRRSADDKGRCFALMGEAGLLALCGLASLEWDSRHFEVDMARLWLARAPGCPPDELASLVRQTVKTGGGGWVPRHVSIEVDIDDYDCLNALLANGFEILDLKRTWCAVRLREDIDFIRMSSRVRPYRPQDRDAVLALFEQVDFQSRFSRDPFLSRSKVQTMYRLWLEKLLSAEAEDALALVYEKGGAVTACGAIEASDFSDAGLDRRMMSGGLYLSAPRGVGGYIPIMHALTLEAIRRHGIVETTVSLNNTAACRVIDGFRSYSGSVVRYALRLWQGDLRA